MRRCHSPGSPSPPAPYQFPPDSRALTRHASRSAHHRFLGTQHPLVLHLMSSWPSTLIRERQVSHLSLAQRAASVPHRPWAEPDAIAVGIGRDQRSESLRVYPPRGDIDIARRIPDSPVNGTSATVSRARATRAPRRERPGRPEAIPQNATHPLQWRFSRVSAEALFVWPQGGFVGASLAAALRGCGCRSQASGLSVG